VATLGKKRNKCSEQSVGGNYVGKRFHVQHLTTHRFIEQETSPNSGTAGSAAKRCLIHTARVIPTANTPCHLKKLDFFLRSCPEVFSQSTATQQCEHPKH
jgi:hypothetical protein